MRIHVIPVVLSALVFWGCTEERKSSPQKKVTRDLGNISTLDASDVLIRVGKYELTKGDLDDLADLRVKRIRMTSQLSANKGMLNRFAVLTPMVADAPVSFRSQSAILTWAETNGLNVSSSEIAALQQQMMRSFGINKGDFSSFLGKFTDREKKAVEKRVRIEATINAVRKRHLESNPVVVETNQVDKFCKWVDDYNRRASETNVLVWAFATNLWNRAKSGEDFGKLADKYSQEEAKSSGGAWGTFRLSELTRDGDLASLVSSLEIGEVSRPVEADNGLNLIKLVAIVDANDNPVQDVLPADARYELARIFLQLPLFYDVPTKEEAFRELRNTMEEKSFVEFVQKLIENDGVVFPLGLKMFETARKQMRMPMMVQQEGVTEETLKKQGKNDFKKK